MVGRVSSDVKKGLRAERYLPLPTHPPPTPRAKVFIRIHHHEKGRKKGKRGNLEAANIALFCVTKKKIIQTYICLRYSQRIGKMLRQPL